ncbi:MAG: 40S ribosomal protein S27-like [Marteilia pararefringens]
MVKAPNNPFFLSRKESQKLHKSKRLIPNPNSYGLILKCECEKQTRSFSNATQIVKCYYCSSILLKPTSGLAKKIKVTAISKFGLEQAF